MNNDSSNNIEEMRSKIRKTESLYFQAKESENAMYDDNLTYIEGTLEKYSELEKSFNKLAQEVAEDLASHSDDVEYIKRLFGMMPDNLVVPFLQVGIQVLQNSITNFEDLRTIIKERIARARQEELKTECDELRVEKLTINSKTKQEAYDSKLKWARKTDIEVYGKTLGTMMSEIREETIEQGFNDIDEVEELINSNPEFKKVFIKNADLVLKMVRYSYSMVFPVAYERLFGDPQLRQVILDALPTIAARTSWKKGIIFDILEDLSEEQQKKYAEVLFVKSTNPKMSEVNYENLINTLLCCTSITNQQMLEIIANNMENIIIDDFKFPETIGTIIEVMNSVREQMPEDKYRTLIDLIDTALVNNIETIMNKENDDFDLKSGYTSESFDGFNKFQEEIRKRGIDVFNSALYIGEGDIEECKRTAEKYFGKCDTKMLITMMYGKYGKERTAVIAGIIEELQIRAGLDTTLADLEITGKGQSSSAILIGEYVVKIGRLRHTKEMPNDRRILQPIIRQRLPGKKMKEGLEPFIEVQNKVEKNWTEGLTQAEIEEELYKIYKEMRDRGHIFADVTPGNVGRLIKANRPNYGFRDINGEYKDIRPTEEATGLRGEIPSEEVLEPGELVILDSDLVFDEKEFNFNYQIGWPQTNSRRKRFERRYDEEKESEKQDSERQ